MESTRVKKIPKGFVGNLIMFFTAPLLYLPFLYQDIISKKKYSLIFLALTFGLISFLYIPADTNDKAKYIIMYHKFVNYDLITFINYLVVTNRPDFILHLILFFFAKLNINSAFFFMLITTYTVYTWFYVGLLKAKQWNISGNHFLYVFILMLLSLSLPDLFSGIKFYFANATLLWGFLTLEKKQSIKGILLIFVAILSHFSVAVFGIIIIAHHFFPNSKIYRYFFLISLSFLFISKNYLITLVGYINPNEAYNLKADIYLTGNDLITRGVQKGSQNYSHIVTLSTMWIYFAYSYLIITFKNTSPFKNLLYLLLVFVNLTYCVPTAFTRYLITIKIIFGLHLIYDSFIKQKKIAVLKLFICLYAIHFCFNIIILRNNFESSLLNKENILITTLLNSR